MHISDQERESTLASTIHVYMHTYTHIYADVYMYIIDIYLGQEAESALASIWA